MNKERVYVYVAGPLYSTGDVEQNIRRAIFAGDRLAKAGYAAFIPHLTHFWGLLCSTSPVEYRGPAT